ncbi:M16 family metallopeptidase [Myxococcota bacterium]
MPDRSKLPDPTPVPHWAPPQPATFRLSNGIRVWYAKFGLTPLTTVVLILPRGGSVDPSEKAGLTTVMADLLDGGAAGRTTLDIASRWRELGTDYATNVDVDSTELSLHLMADTFAPSLELLADLVQRPELSAGEFQRCKEQRMAQALSRESDPASTRWPVQRRLLFGDGYAGDSPRGMRHTLEKITLADVRRQYRRVMAANGAEFVVVGGIDEPVVRETLERTFGQWKGNGEGEPRAVTPASEPAGVYLVDFPGAAQSNLAVTRRAPGADAQDFFPALVFNRIFGGAFVSRLNMNLREDKGFTYGASSRFRRYRMAGCFELQASVKTADTRASVDEMLKELRSLQQDRPLTETELSEAVSGLLLGFPGNFQRVSDLAGSFAALPVLGREPDWYTQWPGRVSQVAVADAQGVARSQADPKDFLIVLTGDRAVVEPTLSSLGLPMVLYDAQARPVKSER